MTVDETTVMKIAHLARLNMAPDQLESARIELNCILQWIEQLDEVDISQVQSMTGICQDGMRQRADDVTDGNCAAQITANAPQQESYMFVTPKVV